MASKIYKAIQNIILIISVIVLISLGIAIGILNMHVVVVVSGSMEPTIKTGSICFIDPNYDVIYRGDVISFYKEELSVTHRVIDIKSSGYVTKGDNNESADPGVVKKSKIIGKCVFVIPRIGYVAMLLKTLEGAMLILSLVIAFLLAGLLIRNKEKMKR